MGSFLFNQVGKMMDMHFSAPDYGDYIDTPIIFSYTYYFKKTMKHGIALFLISALLIYPLAADIMSNILPNAPANTAQYPNQVDPNNPSTWPQQSSSNPVYTNPSAVLSSGSVSSYPYQITCPPNQLICAGSCSPYYPCLTTQFCNATGGYAIGTHCYICPLGQVLYNGNCVSSNTISCPTGQVFDGYGCVCKPGYLAFALACVLDCGENAYVLGNQCTCLPNYSIYQGKCVATASLCQPGFTFTGGKCQCPAGQVQVSQFSCMPSISTSCLGGVWSPTTSTCICPWYLYLDAQTYNCVPCNTADRQIANNGTCTCAMNYQPVNGGCQQCPPNTYYEPSLAVCAPITSYLLTPCLSNQFRDMNNYYQCTACPVQCISCLSFNLCTACANGYVIQPNTQTNSAYQWGYPAGYSPYTSTNQGTGSCVPYTGQFIPGQTQYPQQQQQPQYIQSPPIQPNYNLINQQATATPAATYTPIPGYYYAAPQYTAIGSTSTSSSVSYPNPTPSYPVYPTPTPTPTPYPNPTPTPSYPVYPTPTPSYPTYPTTPIVYQQPLLSTSAGAGTLSFSTVAAPSSSSFSSAPLGSTSSNLVGSSAPAASSTFSSSNTFVGSSGTVPTSSSNAGSTYVPTPLPTGN